MSERRLAAPRTCLHCGTVLTPTRRPRSWCGIRCRTLWLCDHPHSPDVNVARHTRLMAVVEIRFAAVKASLRRASVFTVDGWAQRPGGGRGMEDWGHEE